MDFPEEHSREEVVVKETRSHSGAWAAAAVLIALVAALVAFSYGHGQQSAMAQLVSHQADMTATINQLQNQLSDATAKLNNLAAARTAPPAQAGVPSGSRTSPRIAKNDPRWKKMQSQLDEQKQTLADQQNAINQTRTDLEGNIASSHDELSGSIARTHDELVALEQRGERNYDEFDLTKGKNNHFYRTGPISLELKKADAKHKHYDLALLIDDNEIQKKNVNLYEPVWLRNSTDGQPLEVVVNRIDKDRIHGYVSSPKYAQGQVRPANSASAPASSTPQSQ